MYMRYINILRRSACVIDCKNVIYYLLFFDEEIYEKYNSLIFTWIIILKEVYEF